jgi:hypothetical protein
MPRRFVLSGKAYADNVAILLFQFYNQIEVKRRIRGDINDQGQAAAGGQGDIKIKADLLTRSKRCRAAAINCIAYTAAIPEREGLRIDSQMLSSDICHLATHTHLLATTPHLAHPNLDILAAAGRRERRDRLAAGELLTEIGDPRLHITWKIREADNRQLKGRHRRGRWVDRARCKLAVEHLLVWAALKRHKNKNGRKHKAPNEEW